MEATGLSGVSAYGTKLAIEDRAVGGGTGFFGESLRSMSVERRRQMVEPAHPRLPIMRQCELVSISRSGLYHRPVCDASIFPCKAWQPRSNNHDGMLAPE